MRYYAEWLDNEYVDLAQPIRELLSEGRGFDPEENAQRFLRMHALFGSTIVLSDVQQIDPRLPRLFHDESFREYLTENPHFLSLVSEESGSSPNRFFRIAMRGVERLMLQKSKPHDSYEQAITELGDVLFEQGDIDPEPEGDETRTGKLGELFARFPRFETELEGVLRVLRYFSHPANAVIVAEPHSPNRTNFLSVLENVLVKADPGSEDARRAETVTNLVKTKVDIPTDRTRRAVIRKLLGEGEWKRERWQPGSLRMYLDIVHAWNWAIKNTVAPEAASLYESPSSIKLSSHFGSVSDALMIADKINQELLKRIPDKLIELLNWDPLSVSWTDVRRIADLTRDSARTLQNALETRDGLAYRECLVEHATRVAECLVGIPRLRVPLLLRAFGTIGEFDWLLELIEKSGPSAYAELRRFAVVHSLTSVAERTIVPDEVGNRRG